MPDTRNLCHNISEGGLSLHLSTASHTAPGSRWMLKSPWRGGHAGNFLLHHEEENVLHLHTVLITLPNPQLKGFLCRFETPNSMEMAVKLIRSRALFWSVVAVWA